MSYLPGVYIGKKKNGDLYYRSSITYRNKHISLGSYSTESDAHQAYVEASNILKDTTIKLEDYSSSHNIIPYDKWVMLHNFRDNGIYIKTPIYLGHRFFHYYLSNTCVLKFDVDDLFYYSTHKIMKRGNHLFVSDFGMQVNILSRYGIKNYSVIGKDFIFVNGDTTDFRYGNIQLVNKYHGVSKIYHKGTYLYITKIIIKGSNLVGRYTNEIEAAIAFNKAAQILWSKGITRNYPLNYILDIDEIEYASIYNRVRISKRIRSYELQD